MERAPKEGKFYFRPRLLDEAKVALHDLESSFLCAPYLTQEYVVTQAEELAISIMDVLKSVHNVGEQITIILNFLNVRELLQMLTEGHTGVIYTLESIDEKEDAYCLSWVDGSQVQEVTLSVKELEAVVYPIREKVLRHLREKGIDVYAQIDTPSEQQGFPEKFFYCMMI